MDTATEELLSRYLDDDLSKSEVEQFELRLADDPALGKAVEEMAELQHAVSELASRMTPPPALDALMEPLRRSQPQPRGLRSAYGWLAAAATVIIGVSIAVEYQRLHPQPALDASGYHPVVLETKKDEIYQLQPLPSAAPGTELLGATEHLLAEPHPEPPEAADPPPLVVVGPLSEDEAALEGLVDAKPDVAGDSDREFAPAPQAAAAPAAEAKSARAERSRVFAGGATIANGILMLSGTRHEFRVAASVPSGRYPVIVTVENEAITHCRVADRPQQADRNVSAAVCSMLSALQVPGQSDGEIEAIVEVP